MRQLVIDIPENVPLSDFDLRMTLAAHLYDVGKLSSGQAAQVVGLSKRAFVELLGVYGVSIFGYGFEEIESDLKHVQC